MTVTSRTLPSGASEAGAASISAQAPREHPLHASLVRPIHYFGVERQVLAIEATLVAALVLGVGPHLVTLAIATVVLLVIHPVMAWLTARDPHVTEVYLRSRAYADFYAPHAALAARRRAPRVRPSVPYVH